MAVHANAPAADDSSSHRLPLLHQRAVTAAAALAGSLAEALQLLQVERSGVGGRGGGVCRGCGERRGKCARGGAWRGEQRAAGAVHTAAEQGEARKLGGGEQNWRAKQSDVTVLQWFRTHATGAPSPAARCAAPFLPFCRLPPPPCGASPLRVRTCTMGFLAFSTTAALPGADAPAAAVLPPPLAVAPSPPDAAAAGLDAVACCCAESLPAPVQRASQLQSLNL